jgi:hypothetical protein
MKLLLIENPDRLSFIDKILSSVISNPDKRQTAANMLLDVDPTRHKKLAQWLARLVTRGFVSISGIVASKPNRQAILPEDGARITDILATFERSKPRIEVEYRDINKFPNLYSLEDKLKEIVDLGKSEAIGSSIVRKMPGADIVYRDDTYTLYAIDRISRERLKFGREHLSPEEERSVKAVEKLGMGPPETNWCTREKYPYPQSGYYLSTNDIYILYKDGMPLAQKCGTQVMDVNDRPTELPDVIEKEIERIHQAKLTAARAEFKKFIESGSLADGKSAVMCANRTMIICDKVLDVGPFYYIGIDRGEQVSAPNTRRRSFYNALLTSGMASFNRVPKYPQYRKKVYLRWEEYTPQEKEKYRRTGKGPDPITVRDTSTMISTIWNYKNILTVNKQNIADVYIAGSIS